MAPGVMPYKLEKLIANVDKYCERAFSLLNPAWDSRYCVLIRYSAWGLCAMSLREAAHENVLPHLVSRVYPLSLRCRARRSI